MSQNIRDLDREKPLRRVLVFPSNSGRTLVSAQVKKLAKTGVSSGFEKESLSDEEIARDKEESAAIASGKTAGDVLNARK